MIFESIIATANSDHCVHLSPLGYRREATTVTLSPFVPSRTLDNLRRHPHAVLNFTDDVRVFAGCLTNRRDWPTRAADAVDGWRLENCLAHVELSVVDVEDDPVRPTFRCSVVHECSHRPFVGYNRAQAAVIEAAILATRLDWLEPEKVASEIEYLSIAVRKTGGPNELQAWRWLIDKINEHPRHRRQLRLAD